MPQGILLSSGSDIDIMVHGLLKYKFFGHEVWITMKGFPGASVVKNPPAVQEMQV